MSNSSQALKSLRIAVVHDSFVQRGGAEIVVEELLRIFPNSDVYALYASNRPYVTVAGRRYQIHTTFLQRLPLWFRRHPRRLAVLLPHAAEQLDLSMYDLVLTSSSAFAKGVITRSVIPHVCYCHTPTRFVWERRGGSWFEKWVQHYLRIADYAAAQRPDSWIANSYYTQQRIHTYYRRSSQVIYPPIDTTFFTPSHTHKPRKYFLAVGRLSYAKQFERAIAVCEKLEEPLVVVGSGYNSRRLRRLAGPHTTFTGRVGREKLRELYRGARALLQPSVEDFGMAAAESLACGTPVIGVDAGGLREIVSSPRFGQLYSPGGNEQLAEAIGQFAARESEFPASTLQQQALKFSRERFRQEMMSVVRSQYEIQSPN